MAYDLELRPPADAVPLAPEELHALAVRVGAAPAEAGRLSLHEGGVRLSLRVHTPTEGGAYLAIEVPYGAPAIEAGEALEAACRLAAEGRCRVIDPQLGREVGRGDRTAVEARFAEASAFAVRWTGVTEDVRSFGAEAVVQSTAPAAPTRALLAVAGLLLGAFVFAECALEAFAPPPAPPAYAEPEEPVGPAAAPAPAAR